MVLIAGFNEKRNEPYKVFLETYPYKVYLYDYGYILDTAYEQMLKWTKQIKREIKTGYKDDLIAFMHGEVFWIKDIEGNDLKLDRDLLVTGIGKALYKFKDEMIDYKGELKGPCLDRLICDYIVQLALYGKYKFE